MTKTKKSEIIADLDEYNFDQMIKKSKNRREQKKILGICTYQGGEKFYRNSQNGKGLLKSADELD